MLPHSDLFLCSNFTSSIKPKSQLYKTSLIPKNLTPVSPHSFLFCDGVGDTTRITQMNLKGQTTIVEELFGTYTSWNFSNDYAFLLNKEGDVLFYNMLSKNVFTIEKQHPGNNDVEIHHTDEIFITCGGCLKNQIDGTSQRIIKIWNIQEEDQLTQKSRISTGHTKQIQNSFMLNKSKLVTLSTDKSLRVTNLVMEHLQCLISVDSDLLSGCPIDYSSVMVGGNDPNLRIYDIRRSRAILCPIKIQSNLIQISNISRFSDNYLIIGNINEVYTLDLRKMQPILHGKYDGERICQIKVLNKKQFIIGNRQKTFQIWQSN